MNGNNFPKPHDRLGQVTDQERAMTSSRRASEAASVVEIVPERHTITGAVGLTEEERRILLAELGEMAAELDGLRDRAKAIWARIHRVESSSSAGRQGVA